MTIWKGGPVNNIDELGAGGNIICIGPSESVERFLEIETAKRYFDKAVYSEQYCDGWRASGDDIVDEDNDIHRVQIALAWFSKLIPVATLGLRLEFPDCDFEMYCDFESLSDWWELIKHKSILNITELIKQGKLNSHEPLSGSIRFGKSYANHVRESIGIYQTQPMQVNQEIDIIKNKIDISKSFFMSE